MRNKSVWEHACGLTRTVVEGVSFDVDADAVVVAVRAGRESAMPVRSLWAPFDAFATFPTLGTDSSDEESARTEAPRPPDMRDRGLTTDVPESERRPVRTRHRLRVADQRPGQRSSSRG